MKRIILITGGSRSGKSTYAEKLALSLSSTPVYLATARIWDEEFRKRVIHHQARRGPEWTNIEEEKELSRHALSGRTILIDCITLWCTNFFFDLKADTDQALTAAKEEFDRFTSQDATFIFVTNEIGMGGTSENESCIANRPHPANSDSYPATSAKHHLCRRSWHRRRRGQPIAQRNHLAANQQLPPWGCGR